LIIRRRSKPCSSGSTTSLAEHIYPNEQRYQDELRSGDRWQPTDLVEELKRKARAAGLWNLYLPDAHYGAGLTNPESAPLCVDWAAEVFNCSAPDTGNMETWSATARKSRSGNGSSRCSPSVLLCHDRTGSGLLRRHQDREPHRAPGRPYVINGRKWWATGAPDRRCRLFIFMGKTDPDNLDRHKQQSIIQIPHDAPGVKILHWLSARGYDHAPQGHGEVLFENVKVPVTNVFLGEGRGFEITQGRLGLGRLHHCVRAIGQAESGA
jgi:acyl-CoA dehydrogenase